MRKEESEYPVRLIILFKSLPAAFVSANAKAFANLVALSASPSVSLLNGLRLQLSDVRY